MAYITSACGSIRGLTHSYVAQRPRPRRQRRPGGPLHCTGCITFQGFGFRGCASAEAKGKEKGRPFHSL